MEKMVVWVKTEPHWDAPEPPRTATESQQGLFSDNLSKTESASPGLEVRVKVEPVDVKQEPPWDAGEPKAADHMCVEVEPEFVNETQHEGEDCDSETRKAKSEGETAHMVEETNPLSSTEQPFPFQDQVTERLQQCTNSSKESNAIKDIDNEKFPFACKTCGKRFTMIYNLRRHEKIHSGDNSFACSICNKLFKRKDKLNDHERLHRGEKSYTCKICNKDYSEAGVLKKHERTHSGEKPYECQVCNKRFTESGNLKKHERIHTGEKPFSCSICKKEFHQYNHLKEHMRTHTGDKPYSCSVCKKEFSVSSSLRKHLRIHTKKGYPTQSSDAEILGL